jgi:hypothetical protein
VPLRVPYDANVLYPNTLRDMLIRVAQADLTQARWTNRILDEMERAIRRRRPDIEPAKFAKLRELMNASLRDCKVEGYEPLIDGLKLPDEGDRHVLDSVSSKRPRRSERPDRRVADQARKRVTKRRCQGVSTARSA